MKVLFFWVVDWKEVCNRSFLLNITGTIFFLPFFFFTKTVELGQSFHSCSEHDEIYVLSFHLLFLRRNLWPLQFTNPAKIKRIRGLVYPVLFPLVKVVALRIFEIYLTSDQYPFILLSQERICESEVSCPRRQSYNAC